MNSKIFRIIVFIEENIHSGFGIFDEDHHHLRKAKKKENNYRSIASSAEIKCLDYQKKYITAGSRGQ